MLPSGLPTLVADNEDIARFLTQSSYYSTQEVKPAAFMPSPNSRETSVSRHGQEPMTNLQALGRAAAGTRNLHGAAVLRSRAVREAFLEVLADEPPERHAVIRKWPWPDDADMRKAQQKEIAQQLAAAAGAPVLFEGAGVKT